MSLSADVRPLLAASDFLKADKAVKRLRSVLLSQRLWEAESSLKGWRPE
jgi:hypothetical protein